MCRYQWVTPWARMFGPFRAGTIVFLIHRLLRIESQLLFKSRCAKRVTAICPEGATHPSPGREPWVLCARDTKALKGRNTDSQASHAISHFLFRAFLLSRSGLFFFSTGFAAFVFGASEGVSTPMGRVPTSEFLTAPAASASSIVSHRLSTSLVGSSFGVSRIAGRFQRRLSASSALKPARPISPLPMCSWRSRCEPSGPLESLK